VVLRLAMMTCIAHYRTSRDVETPKTDQQRTPRYTEISAIQSSSYNYCSQQVVTVGDDDVDDDDDVRAAAFLFQRRI